MRLRPSQGAEVTGEGGPSGQISIGGIVHASQREAVCRCHLHLAGPLGRRQQSCRPAHRPSPLPHSQQRPDEAAHHRMAERVRRHPRTQQILLLARPVQALQLTDSRGAVPPAAERGEVMLTEQRSSRPVERNQIKRAWPSHHMVTPKRIRPPRRVGDTVEVMATKRGEPSVEAGWHRADTSHPNIGGQCPGQPADHRGGVHCRGQVGVGNLPAGMDARVRSPSRGQPHIVTQHQRQSVLDHAAHGAQPRLPCPAGEPGPVIGDIQPKPREPATVTGGGLTCVVDGVRQDSSLSALSPDRGSKPAFSASSSVANHTSATVRS